ncbi:MAG: hypothetical protein JWQ03_115 [Variovorax sp.]|nr:hypothetical protein [Variovorax sp.]
MAPQGLETRTPPVSRLRLLVRAVALVLAAAALAGVFALYTRPNFLVTLIDQVWGCF